MTCGSTADPNTVFDTTPVEGAPPDTTLVMQGPYVTYYVERGECGISSSAENIDENKVVRALNLVHKRLGWPAAAEGRVACIKRRRLFRPGGGNGAPFGGWLLSVLAIH